jgi:hypothetical protein
VMVLPGTPETADLLSESAVTATELRVVVLPALLCWADAVAPPVMTAVITARETMMMSFFKLLNSFRT